MKKLIAFLTVTTLLLAMLAGCSTSTPTTSNLADATTAIEAKTAQTQIEFFQTKTEAVDVYKEIIASFEAANPDIKVTLSTPPDAGTVLKTRAAKNDVPDVIASDASNLFADMATNGFYLDMTDMPELDLVQDAYLQTVKDVAKSDKVYGVPSAANADAIIYNKAIFKELGLSVPQTWDELIATAEKVKNAGKVPFYFTFKDAWTTLPAYNVLAANLSPTDFFKQLDAGTTTFSAGYKDATDKFVQLLAYGHNDNAGKTYGDGNTAFAKGEAAMYLQGIWAIAEIQKANPSIDLGVFPYPVGANKVVSGVDVLLSVSSLTQNKEAALKFVNYLLTPEVSKKFITNQMCYSAVKGVAQDDAILSGLQESFNSGLLIDFPDHYIPAEMAISNDLQELTATMDVNAFLKKLDENWKVYKSQTGG